MSHATARLVHAEELQPNSEPMADRELKQLYCNSVQALKDYIAQTNLLSHDITGARNGWQQACMLVCSWLLRCDAHMHLHNTNSPLPLSPCWHT